MRTEPQTQAEANALLGEGLSTFLASRDTAVKAITTLWTIWFRLRLSNATQVDVMTFVSDLLENIDNLATTIQSINRFHIPKNNKVSDFIGGMAICDVFDFLIGANHRRNDIARDFTQELRKGKRAVDLIAPREHVETEVPA